MRISRRSADGADVWQYDVPVESGALTERTIRFDAGTVLVRAVVGDGRELIGDETIVDVFSAGARTRPVARTVAGARIAIGSGAFDIRVRNTYDGSERWAETRIAAGDDREITVVFDDAGSE